MRYLSQVELVAFSLGEWVWKKASVELKDCVNFLLRRGKYGKLFPDSQNGHAQCLS